MNLCNFFGVWDNLGLVYGNYPPEATCGYSCKHKKTLEEDPSAFAFDEVYDDMKHRDIVPKLQDRQDLKLKTIIHSNEVKD
ncbi:hypothetical protein YC2023_042676 [Brassica napus]